MLTADETTELLSSLCIRLGFCLPAEAQDRLTTAPPPDVEAFTAAVFVAEGLDPSTADRHLYRQVKAMVTESFRKSGECESEAIRMNPAPHEVVGPADFHDGHILSVTPAMDGQMTVRVQGESGASYCVRFTGVTRVEDHNAEGMLLYSLIQVTDAGTGNHFAFMNWDEHDSAALKVFATSVNIDKE